MSSFGLRMAVVLLLLSPVPPSGADSADPWMIQVTGPSREVIFTNKEAAHFATDTHAREQRSYGGLFVSMHEILDDYVLEVDGQVLEPSEATGVGVWPWMLQRGYESGLFEQVLLPDGQEVLLVRLMGRGSAKRWSLRPRVDMRWIWETASPSYATEVLDDVLCVTRSGWQPGPGVPPCLAVASSAEATVDVSIQPLRFTHPRDSARNAMATTQPRGIGTLTGDCPDADPGGANFWSIDFAFALGASPDEAAILAREALRQRDEWYRQKWHRIDKLAGGIQTKDPRLDKAYRWARASMDALVMNVRGRGIYAGFHWFPNYWSRDTFICIPGATLVTGRLQDAREILTSFLRFQDVDRGSARLGRLPNIVQPGQLQYAGVDGTWWHARASWRYIQACREAKQRDQEYEDQFYAALKLMIDGALRTEVDDEGFLTHGDGETWMDAGGEANPYSPRGDRAVEVQALYYNGLRVAEALAFGRGDTVEEQRFRRLADSLRAAFREHFWDPGKRRLADHLNVDGSPDEQLRPNVILALTAAETHWPALLEPDEAASVVGTVYERLVLPHGVTSLDPEDPDFHPKHLDLDRYYYDEAYHNGDVWYWLSGPMITALVRSGRVEEARGMLDVLVDEILDHGAVGTIREIRDGAEGPEREEFGGATFQAWSLAEMIRAMHEDLAPALGWGWR